MTASIDQVSGKEFDFIIVGGGTAGLTLAARLSEDENVSVLVLEAGPANLDDPLILTPSLFGAHFKNSSYDWAFQTVPQNYLGGRSVYIARGKTLGGSSAINFFQFHRPSKWDLDAFEKLGNPGWNWDLFSKYYEKSATLIPPSEKMEYATYKKRGTDGPLKYSYPMAYSGFEQPFHDALKTAGIELLKDPFLGETNGTWITPVTIDPTTHQRTYAANMHYLPNKHRANFIVLVDAHVKKMILTADANGEVTATGAEFVYNGVPHTVKTRKEVVLSAGALMSPQILELSGIGNKKILENAGVEVILHLPSVGENVQEHIFGGSVYEVKQEVQDQVTTYDCLLDPVEYQKQMELLNNEKAKDIYHDLKESINSGISENRYSASLQKQYQLQLEKIKRGHPDCEIILVQGFSAPPDLPEPGKKYVTMCCFLNHPFSRGNIHVQSSNPLEPPAIDPHYFEEEHDMRVLVELVKLNRRLVKEKPLESFLSEEELLPGPDAESDEAIRDYLKQRFTPTYHTVGSCSMLPREDGGVVDPKLKVYGTTNIRVVDISIIPLQIGAHLQATAYAIGEIAADIIKGKI